jgi:putative membrane protein
MGCEDGFNQENEKERRTTMDTSMHWMPWGGGFWMLIWWALIIVGIVFLIKWIVQQTSRTGGNKSALDILKERYARGEISREEFEQRKRDIE